MVSRYKNTSLYVFLRKFSSIFDVVRVQKADKLKEVHSTQKNETNVSLILKRYKAIEPISPGITKNEFIKCVQNLRSLTMDALHHLPYYKCEDISGIIDVLSRVKYRDVILLQALCEALYWQCNINKVRLSSVTCTLSNLANLSFTPHIRIIKTFCQQFDNPKNRQTIGDYVRLYKFLVLTNLSYSEPFIELYDRIEKKCLNSMGLMNHSQLSLISNIISYLPYPKWELVDKICANFQRKLHEMPMDSFVMLLKNINKFRNDFKLIPKNCPPLILQVVNGFNLSNEQIIIILKTMSIYYIRDTFLLSKLGKLLSERNDLTLSQQILIQNIFSQLNYKHKEFLNTRPMETILSGITKLKQIENCKSIDDVKNTFQDFYQYVTESPDKFIQYSISYINCLAKVDYNKRDLTYKALKMIEMCNLYRDDFKLLDKSISELNLIVSGDAVSKDGKKIANDAVYPANETNCTGYKSVDQLSTQLHFNTTAELKDYLTNSLIKKLEIGVSNTISKREMILSKFNYSKTGLLRIDSSVKDWLKTIAIKKVKTNSNLISKKISASISPFDSIEAYRESRINRTDKTRRGGIILPYDCNIYRVKSLKELYDGFWNRTFGEYVPHPANKRLQQKKLYKIMVEVLFRKRKNSKNPLENYTPSRLYGNDVMLETTSGLTDKKEIRNLFLKRKRYAGSKRAFESNLNYVNKWRLLRRCFLRPYIQMSKLYKSNSESSGYLDGIVKIYKNLAASNLQFDAFIFNNKEQVLYDTGPILVPCNAHVKMGKTVREFNKISNRYKDKWKAIISNILELNSKPNLILATDDWTFRRDKKTSMLISGAESLYKLNILTLKYLKYIMGRLKKSAGHPIGQLTLTNRLCRTMSSNDPNILKINKGDLIDLYRKYMPLALTLDCTRPKDIAKFIYTIANSLENFHFISEGNKFEMDCGQISKQIVDMSEIFLKENVDESTVLQFGCSFVKLLKFINVASLESCDGFIKILEKMGKNEFIMINGPLAQSIHSLLPIVQCSANICLSHTRI